MVPYPVGPVEAGAAALTVDAGGALAAAHADSAPAALAGGVQAERALGHRLVEVAVVGVAVAVALWTGDTVRIQITVQYK